MIITHTAKLWFLIVVRFADTGDGAATDVLTRTGCTELFRIREVFAGRGISGTLVCTADTDDSVAKKRSVQRFSW